MSLYHLYTELDNSEQHEVREYLDFLRDRVAYIKDQLRKMSRSEREAFLNRIASPPAYSLSSFHIPSSLRSSDQDNEERLLEASDDEFMSVTPKRSTFV